MTCSRVTKAKRLHRILADGQWHSTAELVRRVGHTFAVASHALREQGHHIDKRRHLRRPRQYEYRLVTLSD